MVLVSAECVLFQISSSLHSISLEQSYRKVESLAEKLEDLKGRFGWSSAQRLVHSAHLEMEQVRRRTCSQV